MNWAWFSLFSVALTDVYIRLCAAGVLTDLRTPVMAEYDRIEHDVLVIGAGGAGLRAAIEAANAGARSAWCASPC